MNDQLLSFEELQQALRDLPRKAQFAFAAICATRALAEANLHSPQLTASRPALERGVDILWRAAGDEPIPSAEEVASVHGGATDLLPMSEDDTWPEDAFLFASKAIGLGLLMLRDGVDAWKAAASCGGAMKNLVTSVYADRRVWRNEGVWQQQAIELLRSNPAGPFNRKSFDTIPEYERGARAASDAAASDPG